MYQRSAKAVYFSRYRYLIYSAAARLRRPTQAHTNFYRNLDAILAVLSQIVIELNATVLECNDDRGTTELEES